MCESYNATEPTFPLNLNQLSCQYYDKIQTKAKGCYTNKCTQLNENLTIKVNAITFSSNFA